MGNHKRPPEDPQLHACLDEELTLRQAIQLEGALRPGSSLDNRLKTLLRIEDWLQATRPRSPASLSESVRRALDAEALAAEPASPVLELAGRTAPRPSRRWALAPLAAAAALLLALPLIRTLPLPPWAGSSASSVTFDTVRYDFQIRAEDAREVCLSGDFNQWRVCDLTLTRVKEDLWTVSLELPPGRYEYMFVVDGDWVTDPSATLLVDDGFGNTNAVLVL